MHPCCLETVFGFIFSFYCLCHPLRDVARLYCLPNFFWRPAHIVSERRSASALFAFILLFRLFTLSQWSSHALNLSTRWIPCIVQANVAVRLLDVILCFDITAPTKQGEYCLLYSCLTTRSNASLHLHHALY